MTSNYVDCIIHTTANSPYIVSSLRGTHSTVLDLYLEELKVIQAEQSVNHSEVEIEAHRLFSIRSLLIPTSYIQSLFSR